MIISAFLSLLSLWEIFLNILYEYCNWKQFIREIDSLSFREKPKLINLADDNDDCRDLYHSGHSFSHEAKWLIKAKQKLQFLLNSFIFMLHLFYKLISSFKFFYSISWYRVPAYSWEHTSFGIGQTQNWQILCTSMKRAIDSLDSGFIPQQFIYIHKPLLADALSLSEFSSEFIQLFKPFID